MSTAVLENTFTNDPLLQPSAPDSPSNILNALIDDCLLEIFRKLHFSTLNDVANVCVRFNRIAKDAFTSKYHSKQINLLNLQFDRNPTTTTVKDFLKNFGNSIASLSNIKSGKETDLQLKLIDKYCKKLVKLEYNFMNVSDETLQGVRNLFKRLKILRVHDSYNHSLFDVISDCSELEILEITLFNIARVKNEFISPKIPCPKLNEAHFSDVVKGENTWNALPSFMRTIVEFLSLNTQLKLLEIGHSYFKSFINILDMFNELNELKLTFHHNLDNYTIVPPDINLLSSHNLKITDLNFVYGPFSYDCAFIDTISNFSNVKVLKMVTAGINRENLIYLLRKMPNIETIQFYTSLNTHINRRLPAKTTDYLDKVDKSKTIIIRTIVQYANRLTKLKFIYARLHKTRIESRCENKDCPIDVGDYYEILDSVKNRVGRKKLTIEFLTRISIYHNDYTSPESIRILNMVPDLLHIELKTYG